METSTPVTVERSATVGPFRVREILYPPESRQPPHAHSRASVTVVLAGGVHESAGRCEETAGALSVVYKAPGVEHADRYGPEGARTLQVALEPDADPLLLEDGGPPPSWRWLHDAAAARPLLDLWRTLRGPRSPSERAIGEAVLDSLAAPCDARGGEGPPPDWLGLAREALDDHLPRGLAVRHLARLVGVHPVSLSRAFRRHYGCTITDYRRRERVRRAAGMLDGTVRDISRVAFAAGFADHPHLCRTFRELTGLTPGEFRARVGARAPGGDPEPR